MNGGAHRKKRIFGAAVALAVLLGVGVAVFVSVRGCGNRAGGESSSDRGEQDDFYRAEGGLWKLETPLPILREQKYVSSERELADYLVYEGLPGETVVVIEAEGRWKRVEVREGNRPGSAGWADAHRRRAEKL